MFTKTSNPIDFINGILASLVILTEPEENETRYYEIIEIKKHSDDLTQNIKLSLPFFDNLLLDFRKIESDEFKIDVLKWLKEISISNKTTERLNSICDHIIQVLEIVEIEKIAFNTPNNVDWGEINKIGIISSDYFLLHSNNDKLYFMYFRSDD